jgi:HAD superfamily phosphatase (TIGR01668 family)
MLKIFSTLSNQQQTVRNSGLPPHVPILAGVQHQWLRHSEIRGIILDLDNTIVSEDDHYLSPRAEQWIAEAKSLEFQLFLLSNGKRRHRARHWAERLALPLINPAKKPLPFSFYIALKRMQLEAREVVVIGDSLHTDIIGARWVGCPYIQVASLPHPPRWWERVAGRWVQIPFPPDEELWHY